MHITFHFTLLLITPCFAVQTAKQLGETLEMQKLGQAAY